MNRSGIVSVLLAAVFLIFSVTGCGKNPSKEDVLNQLKPANNEQYALHLFYKNSLPGSETTELNRFQNSDNRITDALIKVQFWDHDQEQNIKWAKAIGIKDFPMYVIVDAEGIVLETPYLSQVKEFLSGNLLHE